MIDTKNFQSCLLKTDKNLYKGIGIYYIGYIAIKRCGDCDNIDSVSVLCLIIHSVTGHFKEKKRRKILNSWFDREIWRSFVWN